MSFTDETLMAYADGELDAATRDAVEQAMRHDPALAAKVAQHQSLRADVHAAFAPILDEPLPQRLQAATAAPQQSGSVVQLDAARAEHAASKQARTERRWSWPEWGAMAAMLMVGVLVGRMGLQAPENDLQQAAAVIGKDGALTAQGALAAALSQQLASAAPDDAAVKIGVSFVSKAGNYCRSFMLEGAAGVSGLACKDGAQWKIPVMVEEATDTPASGSYRLAGGDMPSAVLEAIDQRIAGQTLDAEAEQSAQRQGWQR